MTVENLIKKLKKMPAKAEVYWKDHDHGEYEWNNKVRDAKLIDFDNIPVDEKLEVEFILYGKVVMLCS